MKILFFAIICLAIVEIVLAKWAERGNMGAGDEYMDPFARHKLAARLLSNDFKELSKRKSQQSRNQEDDMSKEISQNSRDKDEMHMKDYDDVNKGKSNARYSNEDNSDVNRKWNIKDSRSVEDYGETVKSKPSRQSHYDEDKSVEPRSKYREKNRHNSDEDDSFEVVIKKHYRKRYQIDEDDSNEDGKTNTDSNEGSGESAQSSSTKFDIGVLKRELNEFRKNLVPFNIYKTPTKEQLELPWWTLYYNKLSPAVTSRYRMSSPIAAGPVPSTSLRAAADDEMGHPWGPNGPPAMHTHMAQGHNLDEDVIRKPYSSLFARTSGSSVPVVRSAALSPAVLRYNYPGTVGVPIVRSAVLNPGLARLSYRYII